MAYDAIELRRRIEVCFSLPELRKLAASLGVSESVRWDRGTQEAARDLVREFERHYGLEILVQRLRALRPLVEWPAAQAPPGDAGAPAHAPSPESAPTPSALAPPASAPAPAALAPPSRALPNPSPLWPGTSDPGEPNRGARTTDPRLLIAVLAGLGFVAVAVVIAYGVGRASNTAKTDPTGGAAPGSPAASRPLPTGVAGRAAAALSRALASIGRICEVPPGTTPDAGMLARAFEQCGPAPTPSGLQVVAQPKTPAPPIEPADKPVKNRPPKGDGAPSIPPGPGGACIGACDGEFRACKRRCGSEPTQSSQYDGYQLCRSRCLSTASRCRLGCPP